MRRIGNKRKPSPKGAENFDAALKNSSYVPKTDIKKAKATVSRAFRFFWGDILSRSNARQNIGFLVIYHTFLSFCLVTGQKSYSISISYNLSYVKTNYMIFGENHGKNYRRKQNESYRQKCKKA